MNLLITGGAGFVGSSLAHLFKEGDSSARVVVVDNLKRRGAELNLPSFLRAGIEFVHGDVRNAGDLDTVDGVFDVVIDAAAEPSVHAGAEGAPQYLLQTNLQGTLNSLDFARRRAGSFVFLSTSRVYSIDSLRAVALVEASERFEIDPVQSQPGVSVAGIDEGFSTATARSLYGATKLASELFVQEYAATYGLRAVINRCGVIAGAGQFGKVDQGVFTMWVANHFFGRPLTYTGFGGHGKQVRDLLHPADLHDLIQLQIGSIGDEPAAIFNVGAGPANSVSLREMTALCREATGREVPIESCDATSPVDVPLYVSNAGRAWAAFGWEPRRAPRQIVAEITQWLHRDRALLEPLFAKP